MAFVVSAAQAGPNSIRGQITGADGKPLPGAEVRAARQDGTGKRLTTKTDAKGEYVFASIPAGRYSISVVAQNSSETAARATATITADGQPVRRFISPLPYQMKPDFGAGAHANSRQHFVWQQGDSGTHIGGRWIKVSEAADPSTTPIQTLKNSDFGVVPSLRINSVR
jgi:hypothetical protein